MATAASRRSETGRAASAALGIVQARTADRSAIGCFLDSVLPDFSGDEFRMSWEDPFYEPLDRLLVKRGRQIVGHVHVTHRTMLAEPRNLPVGGVRDLVVAPDHRGQGVGQRLLRAAEAHIIRSGALIGLISTPAPFYFRRHGWALFGRHSFTLADTRRVLGGLLEQGLTRTSRRSPMHIRPVLRWEFSAVADLYRQSTAGEYGPLERPDAYWHWLLQRQAYDQFFVALEGPSLADVEDERTRVIGYAAIQGERLIELRTLPGHDRAAAELLARACGDAIEANRHAIAFYGPPDDPLHAVMRVAGGRFAQHITDRGQTLMAKVLRPLALLRSQADCLLGRAEAGGVKQPWRLDLATGARTWCLEAAGGQLHVRRGSPGRQAVGMNVADFHRSLLGRTDWDRVVAERRLSAHSERAVRLARLLLPLRPLWRPPLDDLERDAGGPLY